MSSARLDCCLSNSASVVQPALTLGGRALTKPCVVFKRLEISKRITNIHIKSLGKLLIVSPSVTDTIGSSQDAPTLTIMSHPAHYLPPLPLPSGLSSAYIDCTASVGLTFHIIETGNTRTNSLPDKPLILLLHGFPELAFSWRKIMPELATYGGGHHVVAVDQRGYGRTTGWDNSSFDKVHLE